MNKQKKPFFATFCRMTFECILFFLMFIFERERERERERESACARVHTRAQAGVGEGQREKETQNLKQAPGSELSAQSLMQGSNS